MAITSADDLDHRSDPTRARPATRAEAVEMAVVAQHRDGTAVISWAEGTPFPNRVPVRWPTRFHAMAVVESEVGPVMWRETAPAEWTARTW